MKKTKKQLLKKNDRSSSRTNLHKVIMEDKSKMHRKTVLTKPAKQSINIVVKTSKSIVKIEKAAESNKENDSNNNANTNTNANGGVIKINLSQSQSQNQNQNQAVTS